MNPPTIEYLRNLIQRSRWDGGILVNQEDWRRYLEWTLDQLEEATRSKSQWTKADVVDPKQKPRPKRGKKVQTYG